MKPVHPKAQKTATSTRRVKAQAATGLTVCRRCRRWLALPDAIYCSHQCRDAAARAKG